MTRCRIFIVATTLGLSYVLVLYLLDPLISRSLASIIGIPLRTCLPVTGLILGLALCLLVSPAFIHGTFAQYRVFLRESGVVLDRRVAAFVATATMVTFLLAAVLGSDPRQVCHQVALRIGVEPATVAAAALPPIVEELLFRGIVLGLLLRYERPWFAIVWSSLLFGLLHFPQGFHAGLSIAIVSVFLFAVPRFLTASAIPGAFAHLLTNANVVVPTIWAFLLTSLVAFFVFGTRALKRGSA